MLYYIKKEDYFTRPYVGVSSILYFCDQPVTIEECQQAVDKVLSDKIRKICFVGQFSAEVKETLESVYIDLFEEGGEPFEFILDEKDLVEGCECWALSCYDLERYNTNLVVYEDENEKLIAQREVELTDI